MSVNPTYQFRYCLPFIRFNCGEAGLPVFTALMTYSADRNRCFPSYDSLETFTGLSRPSISKAIHGLIELSMIRMVPISERIGNERNLDSRANVYEILSSMRIGNFAIAYLNVNYATLGYPITTFKDDNEYKEWVKVINWKELTSFTDLVNVVNSKEIHYQSNTLENKELTTIVDATQSTTATPNSQIGALRFIFTTGKRGTSKRHLATTSDGYEPLCGGSKRSSASTGQGWQWEHVYDLTTYGLCEDCLAIHRGERPIPEVTPKSPLIVNQTNAALGRTPPPNLTPDEEAVWMKQKPVWSLFAEWHIMNITDNQFQDWREYKDYCAPLQWDEVIFATANMGKWLDQLAKKAKIELTYQWVIGWHRWYSATVLNEKIDKYPTTKDGFKRNFALYVDYLYQQEKQA